MKKLAVALLHLSMLALVCAIAAYWAIRVLTPAPTSLPPPPAPAVLRDADPVLAARMFGLVQAAPVPSAMNVQALGAFSAGRDSAAVLAVDGKPARVYLLNQPVGSGARLVDVRKDAVTIEQGGVRREIALPLQPALGLGGSPPPPGYFREGDTLTAPSVAAAQPATASPRALAPRSALPQQPAPTVAPAMPQPPMQPIPAPPPQLVPPEQEEATGDGAAPTRRQTPGRPLMQ